MILCACRWRGSVITIRSNFSYGLRRFQGASCTCMKSVIIAQYYMYYQLFHHSSWITWTWSLLPVLNIWDALLLTMSMMVNIGVASYGALGHVPPPLDFQLVKILREQIRKMYKNNAILAQFLSIFGPVLSFFAHSFPQGVIIVPKSIANKFQLHTYFRFR